MNLQSWLLSLYLKGAQNTLGEWAQYTDNHNIFVWLFPDYRSSYCLHKLHRPTSSPPTSERSWPTPSILHFKEILLFYRKKFVLERPIPQNSIITFRLSGINEY